MNPADSSPLSSETIARRAYALWEARGRSDGQDVDDWLNAQDELRGELAAEATERARPGDIAALGEAPPPSNLDRALPPAERARARAARHSDPEAPVARFVDAAPAGHFIVVFDRARLRIFSEQTDAGRASPSLQPAHRVDFPEGTENYFARDTDRQGRFPGAGAGTQGMSIDERLSTQEEHERRHAQLIAKHIETFFKTHPHATWDLAAGPSLQHAVLARLGPDLRGRLGLALRKDLSKHPPAVLHEHFAVAAAAAR